MQNHTTRDGVLRGANSLTEFYPEEAGRRQRSWGLVSSDFKLIPETCVLDSALGTDSCKLMHGNQMPIIGPQVLSWEALDCSQPIPLLLGKTVLWKLLLLSIFGVSYAKSPFFPFEVLKAINFEKTSLDIIGASVNGLLLVWTSSLCTIWERTS